MKLTISYEEYDTLCQKAASIECSMIRLPTKEEIDLISSYQTGYFLLLLVWLVENEKGIPSTKETEDLREYVLDKIDDGMSEYMYFSKDPAEIPAGKIKLDIRDYKEIVDIVGQIDFLNVSNIPSETELLDWCSPKSPFYFGFLLLFLYKNASKHCSLRYKCLRNMLDDQYELIMSDKMFQMSEEKYEALIQSVSNCPFKREKWWPSNSEIENIILPNLKNCYDFIIWILNTGEKPSTLKEKESAKKLRAIIRENTELSEEGAVKWL